MRTSRPKTYLMYYFSSDSVHVWPHCIVTVLGTIYERSTGTAATSAASPSVADSTGTHQVPK
ncbi:hypothetical protein OCU04_006672 [Sclerotinia nivalis]|uniref:Uncharacterized protein n=1 Tax=Sclerotinia nivalis TaxID=352851 RepID=A0A9X0AK88_9HELO|nr:hypothetical protein OCU04_006672 [Sclerotinia nivalis]